MLVRSTPVSWHSWLQTCHRVSIDTYESIDTHLTLTNCQLSVNGVSKCWLNVSRDVGQLLIELLIGTQPLVSSTHDRGLAWSIECSKVHLVIQSYDYVWVIDQVWGQDGWILAKFFLCMFMDRGEVKVDKLAKKEWGQYPAILTEQTSQVNKGFIIWLLGKFCLQDTAGSPEQARWLQKKKKQKKKKKDGSILPARVTNQSAIWFILPARGTSHIINVVTLELDYM